MSIFKASFAPYVRTQLRKIREGILSTQDFTRSANPNFYTYTTERQCILRMTSGVDINSDVIKETDIEKAGGPNLAREWILEGGVPNITYTEEVKTFKKGEKLPGGVWDGGDQIADDDQEHYDPQTTMKPRGGFSAGNNYKGDTYGDPHIRSDAGDGYGIVPMPGIIDASIRTKSAYGSLREGKVKFVCHNRRQLEVLEFLYLRPGFPVLLEWQWVPYISNSGKRKTSFPVCEQFFDGDSWIQEIHSYIKDRRQETGGNYDGLMGTIKNFEIVSREDGGYDCQTEIIAMGEVLDSLKGSRSGRQTRTEEGNKIEVDDFTFFMKSIIEWSNTRSLEDGTKKDDDLIAKKDEAEEDNAMNTEEGQVHFDANKYKAESRFIKKIHLVSGLQELADGITGKDSLYVIDNKMEKTITDEYDALDKKTTDLQEKIAAMKKNFDLQDQFNFVDQVKDVVTLWDEHDGDINAIKEALKLENSYFFSPVRKIIRKEGGDPEDEIVYSNTIDEVYDDIITYVEQDRLGNNYEQIKSSALVKELLTETDRIEEVLDQFIIRQGEEFTINKGHLSQQSGEEVLDDEKNDSKSGANYIRWDFLVWLLNKFIMPKYNNAEDIMVGYTVLNDGEDAYLDYMRTPLNAYGQIPLLSRGELGFNSTATDMLGGEAVECWSSSDCENRTIGDEVFEFKCYATKEISWKNYGDAPDTVIAAGDEITVTQFVGRGECKSKTQEYAAAIPQENLEHEAGFGLRFRLTEVLEGSYNPNVCLFPHQIKNWSAKIDTTQVAIGPADSRKMSVSENSIGFMFLNTEHILDKYNDLRYDSDGGLKNSFSITQFFKQIWEKDVNAACANSHNFIIQTENNNRGFHRVIDVGIDKNISNVFELDIQSPSSPVRDFTYQTKIDKNLSSMISIAAQAPNSISDIEGLTVAAFNKNVRNRFSQGSEKTPQQSYENRYNLEQELVMKSNKLKFYLDEMFTGKWNSWIQRSFTMAADDGPKNGTNVMAVSTSINYAKRVHDLTNILQTRYPLVDQETGRINDGGGGMSFGQGGKAHDGKGAMGTYGTGRYIAGEVKDEIKILKSTIIPLTFKCKMDGIGGIIIGNVFKINPKKLPIGYQGSDIAFVVLGESQSITNGQDWTTEINGNLILQQPISEKTIQKQSYPTVLSMQDGYGSYLWLDGPGNKPVIDIEELRLEFNEWLINASKFPESMTLVDGQMILVTDWHNDSKLHYNVRVTTPYGLGTTEGTHWHGYASPGEKTSSDIEGYDMVVNNCLTKNDGTQLCGDIAYLYDPLMRDIASAAQSISPLVGVQVSYSRLGHRMNGYRHERHNAVDLSAWDIGNGLSGYDDEADAQSKQATDMDQNPESVNVPNLWDIIWKFAYILEGKGYVLNQGEKGHDKAVLLFGYPNHQHHVHVSNTNKT